MLEFNKFYFVGFGISLSIYLSFLLFLSYSFMSSNIESLKFTAHKDSFLDIVMVESRQAPESSNDKASQGSTTNKLTTTTPDIATLFKNIDTSKIPTKEMPKSDSTPPSRLKGEGQKTDNNDLSSLINNMNIISQPQSNTSSHTGKYDEYLGRIDDILRETWELYSDYRQPGPEASAEITISKFGNFSYNIVKLSKDDDFNQKFKDCLEELKKRKFPPNPNGQEYKDTRKFNIKD